MSLRRNLNLGSFCRFLNAARSIGISQKSSLRLVVHLLGQLAVGVGEVEQRLDDIGGEHFILLPQVQHADYFALEKGNFFVTSSLGYIQPWWLSGIMNSKLN